MCLLLAHLARHFDVPFAVPLVLAGMTLAFVPGLPEIEFEPELALALFLPPLLQLSAYRTDFPAFKSHLRPILLLAVGAVVFTAFVVAVVAKWLVPELPWGAAIALGAILAPPDAVAAASVLKDLKPPKQVVTVLEGESLLNDASSLVLYRVAVAATVAGTLDWSDTALAFAGGAAGGAAIGWVIGRIAMRVFVVLDDTLHDITASILAGFAAYFAAEAVHASGVIAVVVTGFVLGRQQHHIFTARTRLEAKAVWSFVEFVLTSLIFMLIGLQLSGIVERLERYDWTQLGLLAVATSAALIVSRFAWIFFIAWAPRRLSASLRERDPMPPAAHLTVMSWAGMRGVVSMAAALALPAAFPGRDIILFLAICAIFVTLVVQGTTLGPLIRRLGVTEPESQGPAPEQMAARRQVAAAALEAVEDKLHHPEHGAAAVDLVQEYKERAEEAVALDEGKEPERDHAMRRLHLRLEALDAARVKLVDRREEHDDGALTLLTEELDLEEEQIRRELGETTD